MPVLFFNRTLLSDSSIYNSFGYSNGVKEKKDISG
jgi:hypothetical protein